MSKLLTTKQAAETLAVSVSTLRALVRAGQIFVRKGVGSVQQHMVFDPTDIEDFIKRSKMRLVPPAVQARPYSAGGFLTQRAERIAAKAADRAKKRHPTGG